MGIRDPRFGEGPNRLILSRRSDEFDESWLLLWVFVAVRYTCSLLAHVHHFPTWEPGVSTWLSWDRRNLGDLMHVGAWHHVGHSGSGSPSPTVPLSLLVAGISPAPWFKAAWNQPPTGHGGPRKDLTIQLRSVETRWQKQRTIAFSSSFFFLNNVRKAFYYTCCLILVRFWQLQLEPRVMSTPTRTELFVTSASSAYLCDRIKALHLQDHRSKVTLTSPHHLWFPGLGPLASLNLDTRPKREADDKWMQKLLL